MFLRKLAYLVVLMLAPVSAHALDEKECRAIFDTFNVLPAECSAPVTLAKRAPYPPDFPNGHLAENHVFFPTGGTRLDTIAQTQIKQLGQVLQGSVMDHVCVQLVGHSDTSGDRLANQQIGLARANIVKSALLETMRDSRRIESVISAGENAPLRDYADRSKWQRRVEIRVRKCAG